MSLFPDFLSLVSDSRDVVLFVDNDIKFRDFLTQKEVKYDTAYLKLATVWSTNSYAERHKVGAILVKDGMIISDGFNGMPSGFDNRCEHEMEDDSGESHLVTNREVLHAEANCLTKVAKSTNNSNNATLYVTLSPCFECAKLILQSGIRKVVFSEVYRDTSGLELLARAGIILEFINLSNGEKE